MVFVFKKGTKKLDWTRPEGTSNNCKRAKKREQAGVEELK